VRVSPVELVDAFGRLVIALPHRRPDWLSPSATRRFFKTLP
jgi:hypothetical protein